MEENKSNKWLFVVIILVVVIFLQLNKINKIKEDIARLESNNDELSYALDEANGNIEQANSSIEDAQDYAWSSYNDMGYALDNLETVDTVDNHN